MNRELRLERTGVLQRRVLLVLAAAALLLVGFLAGSLSTSPGYGRFAFLYTDFTIDSCLAATGSANLTAVEGRDAVLACYEKMRLQGALNDFQIRRVNFQTQHFADAVVMWMVVVMTLSGVAFAGYQIVISSRLSPDSMPDSELSVERGRLFVRSSVTGLMILVVSFAFFFIYVIYVYTIYELGEDPPMTVGDVIGEAGPIGPELGLEGGLIEVLPE